MEYRYRYGRPGGKKKKENFSQSLGAHICLCNYSGIDLGGRDTRDSRGLNDCGTTRIGNKGMGLV